MPTILMCGHRLVLPTNPHPVSLPGTSLPEHTISKPPARTVKEQRVPVSLPVRHHTGTTRIAIPPAPTVKAKRVPTADDLEFTSILGVAYAHMLAFNKGKNKAAERFNPADHGYPASWSPSDLSIQPLGANCNYLACPDSDPCGDCGSKPFHEDTLLIALSLAYSDGDNRDGPGSYGIGAYVGSDSEHNIKARLPDSLHRKPMNIQKAELLAAAKALLHVFWVAQVAGLRTGEKSMVVIKTDLSYVVTAITDWLDDWKKNSYRGAKDHPTAIVDLIKIVGTAVRMVERQMKCKVLFWHVKKDENTEAVKLAEEATKEDLRDWS
ncbi:hypothetical protein H2200_009931 [Cladophialophora chaetospira]|uniref:ribonuclease H n=1 Tax=Cladophialophora chaetospira TaxID=386627 RepID=A0AA38X1X6_9EURO|nr:hypothetical protein H2200_009931 [Cladophialophora chaetospira]